jgi:hypothetical protein
LLLVSFVPIVVQAKDTYSRACANEDLHGHYGFTANGVTLPSLGLPAPLTGAFASGGTAYFDGAGSFTLTAISSFHGVIQGPQTVTGTYNVSPDCNYTSQANNGVSFQAVIVKHGSEIFILQATPGAIITGIAEKRDLETYDERAAENEDEHWREKKVCTAEGFSGRYGFLAEGFAGAPTIPAASFGPLAGVGTVDVRPDNKFTMMARRSVNGVLDPGLIPLTGTYTIGSDCTAHLTFDVGFHFDGIITADGVLFIETDPGTAVTVTTKRL